MLDHEDREWNRKFGESYLDHEHTEDHLDDEELDRLEAEFHKIDEEQPSTRSPFGHLERLSDTPRSEKP